MRALAKTAFLLLEVPLTLFAGFYALHSPLSFLTSVMPTRLHAALSSINGDISVIVSSLVGMYGLVLVILGLAEGLILLVKEQHQSKNCLLLPMLVGDVIHVLVFSRLWFPTGLPSLADIQGWSSNEWTSIFSNMVFVVIIGFLRIAFMKSNTKISVAKKRA